VPIKRRVLVLFSSGNYNALRVSKIADLMSIVTPTNLWPIYVRVTYKQYYSDTAIFAFIVHLLFYSN